MRLMAEAGVVTVLLGDTHNLELEEIEPYANIVGKEWPVRAALAFAQLADAVSAQPLGLGRSPRRWTHEGQLVGGLAQGVGQALFERLFGMSRLGLVLPSVGGGGETIADTLITS